MRLVAGIDVGNTTTEVILARVDKTTAEVIRFARELTRGEKGSDASLDAAARLLQRLELDLGSRSEIVAVAALNPVSTGLTELPREPLQGSCLRRLDNGRAATPSGSGFARGHHVSLDDLSSAAPANELIVSIPPDVDFAEAAARLDCAMEKGSIVTGVIVAGDDAVLVGNRLRHRIPIVDEVDMKHVGRGRLLGIEVAPPGATVQVMSDPIALASEYGLKPQDVAKTARDFSDARCGVIIVGQLSTPESHSESWVDYLDSHSGEPVRVPLAAESCDLLMGIAPGSVRALCLGSNIGVPLRLEVDRSARDVFAPNLRDFAHRSFVRRGSVEFTRVALSVLRHAKDGTPASVRLAKALERPVIVPLSEAEAAAVGAKTTLDELAGPATCVCDIGGGTIDLIFEGSSYTAAGAGELLTASVADALQVSRDVAERVKRGPSVRVETTSIGHYETGERGFLGTPAAPSALGQLCYPGPQGPWPFHSSLSPEEWRLVRLGLKARTIGANIERCLSLLHNAPPVLLLSGGAAMDDELVRVLSDVLDERDTVVGRANVAGHLGPRYAVALGLAIAAGRELSPQTRFHRQLGVRSHGEPCG